MNPSVEHPEFKEVNENVLEEANRIIYGDREQTYGDPSHNLERIAELWTSYLQVKVRRFLAANLATLANGPLPNTPETLSQYLRNLTQDSGYGRRRDLGLDHRDVSHMMQCLKWARDENNPKRDNVTDDCGYGALVERCRVAQAAANEHLVLLKKERYDLLFGQLEAAFQNHPDAADVRVSKHFTKVAAAPHGKKQAVKKVRKHQHKHHRKGTK